MRSRSWQQELRLLTFEHELVDLSALADLESDGVRGQGLLRRCSHWPSTSSTSAGRSRDGGRAVPAHAPVADTGEIEAFAAEHGWPIVLKARSGGYDGRGVWDCADPG